MFTNYVNSKRERDAFSRGTNLVNTVVDSSIVNNVSRPKDAGGLCHYSYYSMETRPDRKKVSNIFTYFETSIVSIETVIDKKIKTETTNHRFSESSREKKTGKPPKRVINTIY